MTASYPTIADFPVGKVERVDATITEAMVDSFAALSGDDNPLHMDAAAARELGFPQRVVHGCLTLSLVSTLIGTKLPGKGALWRSLQVDWLKPVFPGDRATISGTVVQQSASSTSLVIELDGRNQLGAPILRGRATVAVASGAAASSEAAAPAAKTTGKATQAANQTAAATHGRDRAQRPILVTGGSRGIGRAIAIKLGQMGHPVVVGFHRAENEAAAVVREIEAARGKAVAIGMDLSVESEVERAIERARDAYGPALGVVHAATPPLDLASAVDVRPADIDRFMQVYVSASLTLVQAMLPAVKAAHWGRFVALGTSALIGMPPVKMAAYVAAKSALWGLVKCLAVELGPEGLTVNLVSPSLTLTDLTRDYSPRTQLAEAQRNPARRLAETADTANFVAFLLSDEAAFINGTHLPVTGGSVIL